MREKTALIVAGGDVDRNQLNRWTRVMNGETGDPDPEIGKARRQDCLWIAADRGLEAFHDLGLVPDVAVGDFDSADPGVVEEMRAVPQIRWEEHRPEKDQTDSELALTIAAENRAVRVVFMGATGTRMDHTLSNIQLLKTVRDLGMRGLIVNATNRIRLCAGPRVRLKRQDPYRYASFLPWSEEVTHLELTGFKYPLSDYHMVRGTECGRCVSNEITAPEAFAEWERGLVLVIESCD